MKTIKILLVIVIILQVFLIYLYFFKNDNTSKNIELNKSKTLLIDSLGFVTRDSLLFKNISINITYDSDSLSIIKVKKVFSDRLIYYGSFLKYNDLISDETFKTFIDNFIKSSSEELKQTYDFNITNIVIKNPSIIFKQLDSYLRLADSLSVDTILAKNKLETQIRRTNDFESVVNVLKGEEKRLKNKI